MDSLKKDPQKPSAVDLSRIRNLKYVLGLALTCYINYGHSIMKEVKIKAINSLDF
jgi:hypothetical protein